MYTILREIFLRVTVCFKKSTPSCGYGRLCRKVVQIRMSVYLKGKVVSIRTTHQYVHSLAIPHNYRCFFAKQLSFLLQILVLLQANKPSVFVHIISSFNPAGSARCQPWRIVQPNGTGAPPITRTSSLLYYKMYLLLVKI